MSEDGKQDERITNKQAESSSPCPDDNQVSSPSLEQNAHNTQHAVDKQTQSNTVSWSPSSPYSDAQQQTAAPRPNKDDERALRSAQTKITFAYIAGPLSLFLGGMLLGCIGLICAGLAYRSLGQLERKEASIAQAAAKLKKSARTALIFCCVAFFLNAVSMYFMYPMILDMLQNGQISDVANSVSSGTASSDSAWG